MRTADWTDAVSVLDRVTAVFEAFGEQDEGLGISELARRANLPKSTVSRIAADLVGQQFLDRDGDKLYLGVRLFELGQTVDQPRRLRHAAIPVMTELRDLTGLTVNLAVLEGSDVVIIAIVRSEPGAKSPATVACVADGALERRTPQTICDAADLLRELSDIRRNGYSVERDECATGRSCVGSAVLGHGSAPLAAVSVTGSSLELMVDRVAPAVRAAGVTLSRRLTRGS